MNEERAMKIRCEVRMWRVERAHRMRPIRKQGDGEMLRRLSDWPSLGGPEQPITRGVCNKASLKSREKLIK